MIQHDTCEWIGHTSDSLTDMYNFVNTKIRTVSKEAMTNGWTGIFVIEDMLTKEKYRQAFIGCNMISSSGSELIS